jgi:hypothetical protein
LFARRDRGGVHCRGDRGGEEEEEEEEEVEEEVDEEEIRTNT